LLHH